MKEAKNEAREVEGKRERKDSFLLSACHIQETRVRKMINVWKNYTEAGGRGLFLVWENKSAGQILKTSSDYV